MDISLSQPQPIPAIGYPYTANGDAHFLCGGIFGMARTYLTLFTTHQTPIQTPTSLTTVYLTPFPQVATLLLPRRNNFIHPLGVTTRGLLIPTDVQSLLTRNGHHSILTIVRLTTATSGLFTVTSISATANTTGYPRRRLCASWVFQMGSLQMGSNTITSGKPPAHYLQPYGSTLPLDTYRFAPTGQTLVVSQNSSLNQLDSQHPLSPYVQAPRLDYTAQPTHTNH